MPQNPFAAELRITDLTTATTATGAEVFEIVQGGVSKQIKLSTTFASLIAPLTIAITNGTGIAIGTALVTGSFTTIQISLASSSPLSVLAVASSGTAFPGAITGTTGQVIRYANSTTMGFGAVNLSHSAAVTGSLTTAYVTGVFGASQGGIGFTTAAVSTILRMANATTVTTVLVLPTLNGGLGFTTAGTGTILAMLNNTTVTTIAVVPFSAGGLGFTTAAQSAFVGFSNATTATTYAVGQLPGIATSAAANTGTIGEYLFTSRPVGSALALTTEVTTAVISLPVPPGDWDLFPLIGFTGNTATIVRYAAGTISDSSTVLNTTIGFGISMPGFNQAMFTSTTLVNTPTGSLPVVRQLLSATTTLFLTANMNFTTSTASVFGSIAARRAR